MRNKNTKKTKIVADKVIIDNNWDDIEKVIKKPKYNTMYVRIGGGKINNTFTFNKNVIDQLKDEKLTNDDFKYCDLFWSNVNNAILILPHKKLTSQGFRINKDSKDHVSISIKYLFEIYRDKIDYDKCRGLYEPKIVIINDIKYIGIFLDEKIS